MIDSEEVKRIHSILIDRFGGSQGIRDKGALEAALQRPFATFDQTELYPTSVDKAAAIIESIVGNHPFVDGNKRIGYTLMRLTLLQNGLDIKANQQDKYEFVMSISKGDKDIDEIKKWIKHRLKRT